MLLAAVAASTALALAACGSGGGGSGGTSSGSTATWTPYKATAGASVPSVNVKFGMRPYADNTFYEIGIKEGWFKDVGISLVGGTTPGQAISTTEDQWTNLLLHGSTDINTDTCAILVTTYSSSQQLKCIQHAVSFFGQVMFANPKLHLKTVEDYIKQGKDFKTALKEPSRRWRTLTRFTSTPGLARSPSTRSPSSTGLKMPTSSP